MMRVRLPNLFSIARDALMPLVRIDLRKGTDTTYRQEIGNAVYEALRCVGVPPRDRFRVITEHDAGSFLFDPDYLGIPRSEELVVIQITWNEGRTLEQKKTLCQAIVAGLALSPGVRPEDWLINLVETKRENGSFGRGVAQYAP
jgi:hypothetical protein